MAHVVSFANQKGGVGKTTSCVNLACSIASLGYKTLLVDFDPQANATSAMGVFDKNIENSIYDAMSKRNAKGCIRKGKYADFIPSSRNLAGAELELSNENEREIVLKSTLNSVKDDYDFVFIDCAPSINLMLINALCASDEVIVPVQCEYFCARRTKSTAQHRATCQNAFKRHFAAWRNTTHDVQADKTCARR